MHKQKTGEGQWVDLACTEAGLSLNGPALLDWSVNGRAMRDAPFDSNRSQYVPMAPHGIYPAAGEDHWVAIVCRHDDDWRKLAVLIDEDWCASFDTLASRLDDQDRLDELVSDWTRRQEKFELQALLRAEAIPVSAVQKPQERVDEDPTTAAFGLWPEVKHSAMGEVRVDGNPVHFSETDWELHHGAPCVGEHTEKVLTELLGMSSDEVQTLREEGVV